MNFRRIALGLVVLITVVLGTIQTGDFAVAAINNQIPFTGTLKDSSGNALTGDYDMVFRIYNAASGGATLWTGTHTNANGNEVTVDDGIFSVMLGSGAGNSLNLDFNSASYYLGITVEGDAEMSPRSRIGAAGYAFNADTVDGLDSTDFLQTSGGSISAASGAAILTITQTGAGNILDLFDGGSQVFSVADGGLATLSSLYNQGAYYDVTNSIGTAGYVLQSTGTSTIWVATSTLGLGGGGGGATVISDLTDVNTTGASTGNVLIFNGTTWLDQATSSLNIALSDTTGDTDDLSEGGVNQFFTNARARSAISEGITGIDYSSATGVFSMSAGYSLTLTASTSEWATAFGWGDHSGAGYLSDITGQTLGLLSDVNTTNVAIGNLLQYTAGGWATTSTSSLGFNDHDSVTLAGTRDYITISGQTLTRGVIDVSDDTNLGVSATGLGLTGDNIVSIVGYEIPLTASSTNWNDFYDSPSDRIAAGTGVSWAGNTINLDNDFGASIDESELNISGGPTDGYVLQASSTSGGGFVWVATSTLGFGGGSSQWVTSGLDIYYNTGRVGISTTTPQYGLSVDDDVAFYGSLYDNSNSAGLNGYVLQSNGAGLNWVATSTLGLNGSASFLGLSDTPGAFTANQIYYSDGAGVVGSNNFVFDGTGVGVGTSTPGVELVVDGGFQLTGGLYDNANTRGSDGMVLQTTGSGINWVATSTLGFAAASTSHDSVTLAGTRDYLTISGQTITRGVIDVSDDTNLGVSATGLGLTGDNIVAIVGYEIPLTASSTNWNTFYDTPSTQITAGNALTWTSNTIDLDIDGLSTDADWGTGDYLVYYDDGGNTYKVSYDSLPGAGGGITSLNGLSAASQSFATTSDTNITLSVTSAGGVHTFNPGWTGTLAVSRGGTGLTSTSTFLFENELNSETELESLLADVTDVFTNNDTIDISSYTNLAAAAGLALSGDTIGPNAGYVIPLSASTTEWANAYSWGDHSLAGYLTTVDMSDDTNFTVSANGLEESGDVLALSAGYIIPLTASTTNWNNFFDTPSTKIAAGTGLSWSGSTINAEVQVTDLASLGVDNQIPIMNAGGTDYEYTGNLTFNGNDLNLGVSNGLAFGSTRFFYASTTNNSIAIGENAGATFNSGTTYNIALGFEAGRYASTTATNNNYIGQQAGLNNLGVGNNIFGRQAGENNTGHYNILIGSDSGFGDSGAGKNNTGSYNTILGQQAGSGNNGSHNNILGRYAAESNSGDYNNILGYGAASRNTGSYNNIFGHSAAVDNNGDYNEIFGYRTGYYLQSTSTVAIGTEALLGPGSIYTSLNNVALGYRAGYSSDDGSGNNILIGYQAADSLTTGANNIIIGYDIEAPSNTVDGQLNIGNLIFGTDIDGIDTNLSSGNVGIGTISPTSKLTIAQSADSNGLSIRGFDNESNEGADLYVDSAGIFVINASGPTGAGYLSAGGTNVAAWTSARLILADNKELSFGNSNDYSWGYNSADDTIRLVDGDEVSSDANTRLVVNSSGNIGIGTTSPASKLDVWGDLRVGTSSIPSLFVDNANQSVGIFNDDPFNNVSSQGNELVIGNDTLGSSGLTIMNQVNGSGYVVFGDTHSTGAASRQGRIQYVHSSDQMRFITNGVQQMVIESGGNVGIGTSSPGSRLAIVGAIYAQLEADGTILDFDQSDGDDLFSIAEGPGGESNLTLHDASGLATINFATGLNTSSYINTTGGKLGIGTTSPTAQLHTTGSVRFENFGAGTLQTDANGNVSVSSDVRLKDIDGNFTPGLAEISKITPIQYYWNEDSGFDTETLYAGFSAQNVRGAIPEAVGEDKNGHLTLSDRPILAALVNTAKEQQLQLAQLLTDGYTEIGTSAIQSALDDQDSVWNKMVSLANGFVDGVLNLVGIRSDFVETGSVETEELCIGATCITEIELIDLLEGSGTAAATPFRDSSNGESDDLSDSDSETATGTPIIIEVTTGTSTDEAATSSDEVEEDVDDDTVFEEDLITGGGDSVEIEEVEGSEVIDEEDEVATDSEETDALVEPEPEPEPEVEEPVTEDGA